MLRLSNKYLVFNDSIVSKKNQKKFEINQSFYLKLKNYLKGNNDEFDEKQLSFLVHHGILVNNQKDYNGFCYQGNLDRDFRLFIQVTNKCNLRCKHCFIDSSTRYKDYFSIDKLMTIVEEAIDLGISRIDFTGGEVFTQPYFLDFLELLDTMPIRYSIFSNLTLLKDHQLIRLSKLKGLSQVITSIDYFSEEKHNIFRGSTTAYEKTIESIQMLNNLNVKVVVNTMVLKDNHDDLEKLVVFFGKRNIPMHFDTVINCGRAESFDNIGNLRDNIEALCLILKKHKIKMSQNLNNDCGVGTSFIYLDYEGIYNLCTGLTKDLDHRYNLGKDLSTAVQKIGNFDLKCNSLS